MEKATNVVVAGWLLLLVMVCSLSSAHAAKCKPLGALGSRCGWSCSKRGNPLERCMQGLVCSYGACRTARRVCTSDVPCYRKAKHYCNIGCVGEGKDFKCKARRKEGESCKEACGELQCRDGLQCVDETCSTATAVTTTEPLTIPEGLVDPDGNGTCPESTVPAFYPLQQAGEPKKFCKKYRWVVAPRKQLPTPPTQLSEIAAAMIGDDIVIIGDGSLNSPDDKRKTYVYDTVKNVWKDPDGFAERPHYSDHTSVEVIKNKMYAFSGVCCMSYCGDECGANQKVQIYNHKKNTWTLGTDIPYQVQGSVQTALINGLIYVCGGFLHSKALTNCAIYNPAMDTWDTNMTNLAHGVHHAAAGTDGLLFYIFGGRQGGNSMHPGQPHTQVYNPQTNTWARAADLPTPRSGTGKAMFLQGEFYILGGESNTDWQPVGVPVLSTGTFNVMEMYNPVTDTWRRGADLPVAVHGLQPVLHNGKLYCPFGGPRRDRDISDTFQVFEPSF